MEDLGANSMKTARLTLQPSPKELYKLCKLHLIKYLEPLRTSSTPMVFASLIPCTYDWLIILALEVLLQLQKSGASRLQYARHTAKLRVSASVPSFGTLSFHEP